DQIIVVNGFSKAFAMTGWRLGYALANKEVSDAMTKIHQYVIMSAPTQAQYAAIEAMTHGLDDVIRMRNDYLNRRNLLVNRLNRMGLDTNMPHGTFYVFPNIQKTGMTCEEFCEKLLEKEKVACVPGNAFGEHGEGFIRISYAYSIDHLKEACDRIEHFLQNLD
ncbi:aminotransferase class I/II-fold pyridoxal phosphate-dependent enzyme, partial [uncultured Faecalicoccus sp.]|uniref:aminotransferase class I/II-fold pyridoxal phosphate-dependent enzyme n=1 Tax=uncultured Faecalicoccus sp. TaxID=1971760 RepID=UPI0025F50966